MELSQTTRFRIIAALTDAEGGWRNYVDDCEGPTPRDRALKREYDRIADEYGAALVEFMEFIRERDERAGAIAEPAFQTCHYCDEQAVSQFDTKDGGLIVDVCEKHMPSPVGTLKTGLTFTCETEGCPEYGLSGRDIFRVDNLEDTHYGGYDWLCARCTHKRMSS